MENIEKFLKHKIFFTQQGVDCDYYYFGKLTGWGSTYKSNTIYNHKKVGDIYDREEFFDHLKPILFYLGSKGLNREENKYGYEAQVTIGLTWKYENSDKYIEIWNGKIESFGSELTFYHFFPCGNVNNKEFSKPFEIQIEVFDQYDLLTVVTERTRRMCNVSINQ